MIYEKSFEVKINNTLLPVINQRSIQSFDFLLMKCKGVLIIFPSKLFYKSFEGKNTPHCVKKKKKKRINTTIKIHVPKKHGYNDEKNSRTFIGLVSSRDCDNIPR